MLAIADGRYDANRTFHEEFGGTDTDPARNGLAERMEVMGA